MAKPDGRYWNISSQVTNKYMSYGNTMWGGDITNCVSTSLLSTETDRGEKVEMYI